MGCKYKNDPKTITDFYSESAVSGTRFGVTAANTLPLGVATVSMVKYCLLWRSAAQTHTNKTLFNKIGIQKCPNQFYVVTQKLTAIRNKSVGGTRVVRLATRRRSCGAKKRLGV